MMETAWYDTFMGWSETPEFRDRVERTKDRIADVLAQSCKPYLAFSGGKDSEVMAHLVTEQRPVMALHYDYGPPHIPASLHQEIVSLAPRVGASDLVVERPLPTTKATGRATLRKDYFPRITVRLKDEGYDRAFVGLRAEESLRRKRRIAQSRSLTAIPEAWPLEDWTWLDVWAYIVSRGLPYLSYYDRVALIVGWDKARFSSLFDPAFESIGAPTVDGVTYWRYRHATAG
jgi:3'-phosphoadenosine 5'-phosphosulfate sulfotransferase (PAPS reductase)/FAD synthetase